jgi:hypothetical protein
MLAVQGEQKFHRLASKHALAAALAHPHLTDDHSRKSCQYRVALVYAFMVVMLNLHKVDVLRGAIGYRALYYMRCTGRCKQQNTNQLCMSNFGGIT